VVPKHHDYYNPGNWFIKSTLDFNFQENNLYIIKKATQLLFYKSKFCVAFLLTKY
jgi:hypothetical protein